MTNYISNAFSLQMMKGNANISMMEIGNHEFKKLVESGDFISAVGHTDTAMVLGVPCNRTNISLEEGDTLYVAQLNGGRLPEGSTTLPEGFSFTFYKVEVKYEYTFPCGKHRDGERDCLWCPRADGCGVCQSCTL